MLNVESFNLLAWLGAFCLQQKKVASATFDSAYSILVLQERIVLALIAKRRQWTVARDKGDIVA